MLCKPFLVVITNFVNSSRSSLLYDTPTLHLQVRKSIFPKTRVSKWVQQQKMQHRLGNEIGFNLWLVSNTNWPYQNSCWIWETMMTFSSYEISKGFAGLICMQAVLMMNGDMTRGSPDQFTPLQLHSCSWLDEVHTTFLSPCWAEPVLFMDNSRVQSFAFFGSLKSTHW